MEYEAVIGLEVHAEMQTRSKMFCACPVVDTTQVEANVAVCPVCAGMPGVLPVVNRQAVEYGLRVALALECEVARTSLFDRKNYFYPDLPKGYQISQYEYPLAQHGQLWITTSQGERAVRVRRVHLEEDTGKLTHVTRDGESYSLVDLNRAGISLLEIVSEPDMHTVEEVRAYADGLRAIVRYLGVNSGDMEKGVIRFEANVSVRPAGSQTLGTRVEIKNLNSFRALERSVAYQIEEQIAALERGESVVQQTLGWDETAGKTFSQRSKEEAHDYRYFPEPDLPPLVVEPEWAAAVAASLPELPRAKRARFQAEFGLTPYEARLLAEDQAVARYFERAAAAGKGLAPRTLALWITGELFGWLNQNGGDIETLRVAPEGLAELLGFLERGEINMATAKTLLGDMLVSGQSAAALIQSRGLRQISDSDVLAALVRQALEENPAELQSYLSGKETLANWFFGQVMRAARGQGNPQVIRAELERQLAERKQAAS
ncbi:Asp-tRNA(Asn)/Glu-tRNA(Gln) amidotransferase subunit GatB [Levilinea saccharolytica]|uniref:Aspartyl/glutamyl-tRNA(Asn/Gln) amidotransferase subunit B n=1 Tax=Levilinea saccharolytica TaxID=229921 RepID=A0A0P6YDA1_9CHLR|nr:Asp-tRNA(Asn)/Glu-tRNA(Gln) amidotransferase subunit GatB [Levilinea saccharolytica]KPL89945.1 glutamyl-tRNA amidotransferase [Levilinea saccharolytica]GAP16360.1 aspartyl/glutamyl-tRNA(Asn/Gln) amidotransferase subunit B [Levilinea saccharolytica]